MWLLFCTIFLSLFPHHHKSYFLFFHENIPLFIKKKIAFDRTGYRFGPLNNLFRDWVVKKKKSQTGTWALRTLSCIRPRCGWNWRSHQAAAEWRSTLHQRTPCRRRPRMSRCVGQGWCGTRRSSSPPARCSLSSPAGPPYLQTGRAVMPGDVI